MVREVEDGNRTSVVVPDDFPLPASWWHVRARNARCACQLASKSTRRVVPVLFNRCNGAGWFHGPARRPGCISFALN